MMSSYPSPWFYVYRLSCFVLASSWAAATSSLDNGWHYPLNATSHENICMSSSASVLADENEGAYEAGNAAAGFVIDEITLRC